MAMVAPPNSSSLTPGDSTRVSANCGTENSNAHMNHNVATEQTASKRGTDDTAGETTLAGTPTEEISDNVKYTPSQNADDVSGTEPIVRMGLPTTGGVPTTEDSIARKERRKVQPISQILSVNFSQDFGCVACATETGFRIFNCEPFKETIRREFRRGKGGEASGSGLEMVEMLFRTNFMALVGGGNNPKFSPKKVMIWDDSKGRCIGELTFRSQVRNVKLRRDKIVVVLEHKVYVYNFADLKLLHQMETISNPKGICALSHAAGNCVLACPGTHRGQVHLELYDQRRYRFVSAHESALSCLSLSPDGRRLATSSGRGTLIRVFNTLDGTMLQELRRGSDRADIHSLSFSPYAPFLALTSGKGTVHVFALIEKGNASTAHGNSTSADSTGNALSCPHSSASPTPPTTNGGQHASSLSPSPSPTSLLASPFLAAMNPGSPLSFMKVVLPKYFSSEWSFAQYHLPSAKKDHAEILASSSTHSVASNNSIPHPDGSPDGASNISQGGSVDSGSGLSGSGHRGNDGSQGGTRGTLGGSNRAQVREPLGLDEATLASPPKYSVAFGLQKNTVMVVGTNGRFFRLEFHPGQHGEMSKLEEDFFLISDRRGGGVGGGEEDDEEEEDEE